MARTTWATTRQVANRMSRQSRRDTKPEVELRSALHAAGLRFRVSYPVPELTRCSIDVAFPRQRIAIFVDGCFWHFCPDHGTLPKTNTEKWAAKLASNRSRDRLVDSHLTCRGWIVLRFWEHEDLSAAIPVIVDLLSAARTAAA